MSRANTHAVAYAQKVTANLREKSQDLETSNEGLQIAQRELEAQNKVLEQQKIRIEEDHDRLRASLDESDALRQEQSEFTYAVSHDLKSPASTMQLVLEELDLEQDGRLNEEGQHFLKLAQQTALRMTELIEDILSYSWVTDERADFQIIDMQECLNGVLSDLAYDIDTAGAEITQGSLDPVFGSKTQIRMLIQNLISNGLKFQEDGAIAKLHIESQNVEGGDFVVITVQDNGIGVAPEYHERIFGLFQRLHVREVYSGTGLGLTTCNRIVKNHFGEISVDSALGEGSTFSVRLPARANQDDGVSRRQAA